MKKCNGPCQQTLDDSSFYRKVYKTGRIGLRAYCKACSSAARDIWRRSSPKDNERNKAYNMANARRIRGKKLVKYWPGVTWEQALANHQALLAEQGGVCAMCKQAGHAIRGLHVDHCHTTGVVRGLLCYNCNSVLGRAKDDTRILLEAVAYLARFKVSVK